MRHTKHYFRAAFLLIGGAFLFLLVRAFLIPPSFGEYGFYRGANVEEQMAKPIHYAAPDACAACHDAPWQTHQKGKHASIPCQDCHAPLSEHVDIEKGELVAPMPIQKTSKLCLRCHLKLDSRPKTQPQIIVQEHGEGAACFDCHKPHDPKNPR